ncbi:MAG: amidase, partial [Nitrososphaerota archaeon]|nr:amidase [Nitrososphaerota archaeon]
MGNEEQVPRTARALGEAYRAGVTTPEEALKRFLERIAALNPRINAFITVLKNEAEKAAALSSRRFKDETPLRQLDAV